jgi:hypothetical protein
LARSPLPPSTLFVHPLALGEGLWEAWSINLLHDRLWKMGFLDTFCVGFWNAMSIDILHINGGFQDVASPSPLVAHYRTFEALRGIFWTNRLMVGWHCKINLWCIDFMCTFSSPTSK